MKTLALFLAVSCATVCRADEPVSPELVRSRRLNVEATRALDAGDLVTALARYREAYDAFPSPKLRFNIGLVLEKLGRASEAADAFDDFLEAGPTAPADARRFAQARLAVLETSTSILTVRCSPPGAELLVNGAPEPCDRARHHAPGRLHVEVNAAERRPFRADVNTVAGERLDLEGEATVPPPAPAPARVVSSTPPAPPPRPQPGRALPIAVGAATLATFVTGIGLRASAQQYFDAYASGGSMACAPHCGSARVDATKAREYAGNTFLVLQGLGVVADVTLWVLYARARHGAARAERSAQGDVP